MVTIPQGLWQGLLCASEPGRGCCAWTHPPHPAPPAPRTLHPLAVVGAWPASQEPWLETRWPEAAPGPAAVGMRPLLGHGRSDPLATLSRGPHRAVSVLQAGTPAAAGSAGRVSTQAPCPQDSRFHGNCTPACDLGPGRVPPSRPESSWPGGSAGSVLSGVMEEVVGSRVLLSEPVVNISRIF